jgi:PAS domain S-box-containing protein
MGLRWPSPKESPVLSAPSLDTGSRARPPADHSVQFYDDDHRLLDDVCDFLDDALRSGGLAIAIGTPDHRAELSRRLAGFGGPVARPGKWFSGSLVLLDAQDTLDSFMGEAGPDAARFEQAITPLLERCPAGRPVHAFGEMVALLCQRGNYDGALALEGLWNGLAARRRFSLFCAYPWRLFTSAERSLAFRHVCAAHGGIRGAQEPAAAGITATSGHTVAQLRQQTIALQAEVARRKEAETTLRLREHELADFLEHASEGIHKVAADGTILYANRAELELLGYRWEEYVGRNIAEFHVDPAEAMAILARLRAGEVLRDQPALLRCRDGSSKPVLAYSNGHFVDGRLEYTRCFTRDATDRLERDRLLDELREASRAKDEFLAMLGHELRNPLSPIVTALQLMRMRGDSATAPEQAIIQRQVDHMVRLVDDLLDISRITRGKIELQREAAHIGTVLAKAVEQSSVLLQQHGHRLEFDVQPDLTCVCDPVRLAQVVANLLTNAARYTPPGGEIHLYARREAAGDLVIRVRDNGSGLAPEILPRLFEPFFQGPRQLARSEGGLGIGLALVRSLVQLHGGTVQAFSEGPGRGSEFVVRLPWVACPDGPDAEASKPAAAARTARRVLLVDDNADAADTLGEFLQAAGHQVAVFNDAAAALGALQAFQPDAAVLDIGLPGMNGYELAARVRAMRGAACSIIALTGYGQESDRARSAASGFDAHLVKPVMPDELLRLLAAATPSA